MGDTANAILMLRRYVADNPSVLTHEIADVFIKGLDDSDVRWFAWFGIKECADGIRRSEIRQIERESVREITPKESEAFHAQIEQNRRARAQKVCDEYNAARRSSFEKYRDNPTWYGGDRRWRNMFRDWMGAEFDNWHETATQTIVESKGEEYADSFTADFSPQGPMAWWAEKRTQELMEMVSDYAKHVRLQVTRELLTSTFALGDGVIVSWGEATIDQHRQRIDLLVGNASGNVETAARHLAAVRMIEESNATCLENASLELVTHG